MLIFKPSWMSKDDVSGKEWSAAEKHFRKLASDEKGKKKLVEITLAVKDPKIAESAVKLIHNTYDLKEIAEKTTFWQVRSYILSIFAGKHDDIILSWIVSESSGQELKQLAFDTLKNQISDKYRYEPHFYDEKIKRYHEEDKLHPGCELESLSELAQKTKSQLYTNREFVCSKCGGEIVFTIWKHEWVSDGIKCQKPYHLYICSKCGRIKENGTLDAQLVPIADKSYERISNSFVYACPVCFKLMSVRSRAVANGYGEFDSTCECSVPDEIYPRNIPVRWVSVLDQKYCNYDSVKNWVEQNAPKDCDD